MTIYTSTHALLKMMQIQSTPGIIDFSIYMYINIDTEFEQKEKLKCQKEKGWSSMKKSTIIATH